MTLTSKVDFTLTKKGKRGKLVQIVKSKWK